MTLAAPELHLAPFLERAVVRYGAREAVVCGSVRLTYAALGERVARQAAMLDLLGLSNGGRVALLHRNCHRFLEIALAAAQCNAILVPLNVRLDGASLGATMADAEAALCISEECFEPLARAAASHAGAVTVASARDPDGGVFAGTPPREAAHVAQIYYTSGTTGAPRGVMLTHGNIASHALMTQTELSLSERDSWAHVAPMFHLADAWAVFAITACGGRHVMFPDFDPETVLSGFARHGVTITNLVPTMLNRLEAQASAAPRSLPCLRSIMSGGAPIAPALVERVISTFGADYLQTYGLTETSPYLTFGKLQAEEDALPPSERCRRKARTGRAATGVELRVVGADGRDVATDDTAVGEIRVRAPWVTPGYWKRPADTAAAFEDGWFCTGDLATWDATGSINIVDRKKDMIITGGEKVFSVEVEQALAAHPSVFECAVIGLPDDDWGEAVTAVVVPRPGAEPAEADVRAWLRARIAPYKVPKRVVIARELPKTGSGKIKKAELRRQLAPR